MDESEPDGFTDPNTLPTSTRWFDCEGEVIAEPEPNRFLAFFPPRSVSTTWVTGNGVGISRESALRRIASRKESELDDKAAQTCPPVQTELRRAGGILLQRTPEEEAEAKRICEDYRVKFIEAIRLDMMEQPPD